MCKSDFHESAWNCAELTDISDIFIGKKSQKFSFFRCWVIRGQSRGNTWFSRLLMVIAQIRKNENLRCIWLIDFLSQVYRLALVSARNMQVTLGPNLLVWGQNPERKVTLNILGTSWQPVSAWRKMNSEQYLGGCQLEIFDLYGAPCNRK